MPTLYTMVAPCFFGTESTLNFEVKRLGAAAGYLQGHHL